MSQPIYPPPLALIKQAHITDVRYREMYAESIQHPKEFWDKEAQKFIKWSKPYLHVYQGDLASFDAQWFTEGKLNVAYNCLDRHLAQHAEDPAIIWQGDNPNHSQILSFKELHARVCRFANVLKRFGIKKGDRICIYLPMIPEAAIAMLACTRIGAVHSVVFAGFSPLALAARIKDAECKLVITANEGMRGGKIIPLKKNVDQALKECPQVKTVIVVKRTDTLPIWDHERDFWYHNQMAQAHAICPVEEVDSNDPMFILYTSGSTGQPKGVLHATGGYCVYVAATFKYVFDYHPREIYWCTADIGWITGHSYGIYGPLLNAATTLMFEGIPTYPTCARYWQIVDQYKVNIFYTAPTALRALRREGNEWVRQSQRKSLRILGTVGETINPEAWEWYYRIVGESRCPIVDTWWQTETGGIMITPFPGATPLKPGSAAWPFFGVVPKIIDENGKNVPTGQQGQLVIKQSWPGMMKTIYRDDKRYLETYFSDTSKGYITGDQASQDQNGYYWIAGRSDDVIKISGHRIGSAEVESALVHHMAVAEAAVVPIADPIQGQNIYAFITLRTGFKPSADLKTQLIQSVKEIIGPIVIIKTIQWADSLPKTRSGKIMRRILRKIANHDTSDLGDLSTLADPEVVDQLIKNS